MLKTDLSPIQQLKISCFSRGIAVSPSASKSLTQDGKVPLSLHEYSTTGGVTVELEGGVYINAPFDEPLCKNPEASLEYNPDTQGHYVRFRGTDFLARVLPLPGYLDIRDSEGNLATDVVMTHADRARLSLISGCSMDCEFCSLVGLRYVPRSARQLLAALEIAKQDKALRVRHLLLSGGTPTQRDFAHFAETCETLIKQAGIPVDIMMVPRRETQFTGQLLDWGIHGFSFNMEVFGEDAARSITRLKNRYMGRTVLSENLKFAVEHMGGPGRVRSLIVVGLEPLDTTLEGIEFLAKLGCDPVISPFRPTAGTGLEAVEAPSMEYLERVYVQAERIAERYGVKLGPRCIPCQNNTLTFPDGSKDYFYS
ncbi:MAG: hypothetical protein HY247_05640 [archaeon]|nr:MAG: hypothetical protein HY247_05640 [archaeon]